MNPQDSGPGGFIQEQGQEPTLPSPAPSAATTTTSASTITATGSSHLPRQRTHPLIPGSSKETSLINYIDKQILRINRRHARKFSREMLGEEGGEGGEDEGGYEGFGEVVRDVEGVVDLVWVSGTPTLQIPYFISLADLLNTYLPDFPFSPRPTFRLLRKLDTIFASLLTGEDAETGATLSGFEGKAARGVVSMTEKVRIKSLAERCRVAVIEVREGEDEDEDEDEGDGMVVDEYEEMPPGRWEMEAARVYEKTIQLLGDEMGNQGPL